MGNVRKHRNIKLVTTNERKNYLASEPNYHTINWFPEHSLAIELKKTKFVMNKPIYLRFSILGTSKIIRYKFWYDYTNRKGW